MQIILEAKHQNSINLTKITPDGIPTTNKKANNNNNNNKSKQTNEQQEQKLQNNLLALKRDRYIKKKKVEANEL